MLKLLGLLMLLAATTASSSPALSHTATRPGPAAAQQLAALLETHTARQAPRRSSESLRVIAPKRPLTGEQTVLPVVGHTQDASGARWLRVMLPGRPNGRTGWIVQAGTRIRATHWRIVVELERRRVTVYRDARVVRAFPAVVGRPSTPAPRGAFFVEESVALPSAAGGAPFALALSARSTVYQEFEGGPGQIAIHGLANIGGVPGTATSHGCVRLTTAAMTWLVNHVEPGVPVTIHA